MSLEACLFSLLNVSALAGLSLPIFSSNFFKAMSVEICSLVSSFVESLWSCATGCNPSFPTLFLCDSGCLFNNSFFFCNCCEDFWFAIAGLSRAVLFGGALLSWGSPSYFFCCGSDPSSFAFDFTYPFVLSILFKNSSSFFSLSCYCLGSTFGNLLLSSGLGALSILFDTF